VICRTVDTDERTVLLKTPYLWRKTSYITAEEYEIIVDPEKWRFDDVKTIDIHSTGAGTLCSILSAHLRRSHGDYNDIIFGNADEVSWAFRQVKSCKDVDIDDFISQIV
jgi:hypothetical protein